MSDPTLTAEQLRAVQRFDRALAALAAAPPLGKSLQQTEVFQAADVLMGLDGGMELLLERADQFDSAGVFHGGPWVDPSRLLPPLVGGSLQGTGALPVVETLSDLRVLAIAQGRAKSDTMTPDDAKEFLEEVLALNLDLVFCARTESLRATLGADRLQKCERLFALLASHTPGARLHHAVSQEVRMICAQRPIRTDRVRTMIDLVERVVQEHGGEADPAEDLAAYVAAIRGPSPISKEVAGSVLDYRQRIQKASPDELEAEGTAFAASMQHTGLVCDCHAVLLRHIRRSQPQLVPMALGVSPAGVAECEANDSQVRQLISVAIYPATAQAIYGLARLLDRSLLSRTAVSTGLRKLAEASLLPDVTTRLDATVVRRRDGVTANGILVAGAIAVLGQPLGLGQGNLPTCQSVRGISLWAQHAPAELLNYVLSAARDGAVQMRFEGDLLDSSRLLASSKLGPDPGLDAVSQVLVPHLDALYGEIMRRAAGRSDDAHKWANPGLYGRWVPTGFASIFDPLTRAVVNYDTFVRRFYATHHPLYNGGNDLAYPNPVGLFITGVHGSLIGLHAVSIQRIAHSAATDDNAGGEWRAYFFNPNNESRQDWGQDIRPTVEGNGELEGEASLPFDEFIARLYAFHYNPQEEGDLAEVPGDVVQRVEQLARESWGLTYIWATPAPDTAGSRNQ